MTPPLDKPSDGFNPVSGDIQWPMISSMESDPDNQSAFPPDPAITETEKLLDIDGLLEMVRIISGAKEDGRLGGVNQESSEHVDE